MAQFQINLPDSVFAALEVMGDSKMRDVRQQAAWLVKRAVEQWEARDEDADAPVPFTILAAESLHASLEAVAAYATSLEDCRASGRQPPQHDATFVALRNAALPFLASLKTWREVARVGETTRLESPDGTVQVLYWSAGGVERVALIARDHVIPSEHP